MNSKTLTKEQFRKRKNKITEIILTALLVMIIVSFLLSIVNTFMIVSHECPKCTLAHIPVETVIQEIKKEELEPIKPVVEEPEVKVIPKSDENAATYIAKTVYGEARGLPKMEQAAVIWCILNRVDHGYSDSPIGVITAPNQFHGYRASNPVNNDIYELALDVLSRWEREKAGETDVGRVLPKEYLYFYGSGGRNHFTDKWRGGNKWDWSLANPYI